MEMHKAQWRCSEGLLRAVLICKLRHSVCPLLACRRWNSGHVKGKAADFPGPIEGLPELMAACGGRENTFAAIVGEELQASQISQVIRPASLPSASSIRADLNVR